MDLIYNESPVPKDIECLENELLEFNRGKIEDYGYEASSSSKFGLGFESVINEANQE